MTIKLFRLQIVMICVFILFGCNSTNNLPSNDDNQTIKEHYESLKDEEKVLYDVMTSEEEGYIEIFTNYGNIYYPKKWEEYVFFEVNNDFVAFECTINEKQTKLFEIHFKEKKGVHVGTVNDKYDIYVLSQELSTDEQWSDMEKDVACAMQEDVNFLILKLDSIEGFKPNA